MKLIVGFVLASIIFSVCDWFGVFGTEVKQIPDFLHITFETKDNQTGKPVADVHVVCSRPMSRSVCSERLTGIPGQTEITFGVFREEKTSLLFNEELGFTLGRSGEMTMTFIHPNYERQVMFINADKLDRRNQRMTVRLVRSDS